MSFRLYCTVEEPDLAINMYKKHRQVNVFLDFIALNVYCNGISTPVEFSLRDSWGGSDWWYFNKMLLIESIKCLLSVGK